MIALVEMTLWSALFASSQKSAIAGFGREYYLSYALWAVFFARMSANWMYEFLMIDEIDTGSINNILVRPISYFEYYLSQFYGYKIITGILAMIVPIAVTLVISLPGHLERLPLALVLVLYNLIFVYSLSFIISSFAFFFNRVHSFTVAKNIALWLFTGELFPLDLLPEPFRSWIVHLPFASGVYLPVGYVTGRFAVDRVWSGFLSSTIGIFILGAICRLVWVRGRLRYSGTGA